MQNCKMGITASLPGHTDSIAHIPMTQFPIAATAEHAKRLMCFNGHVSGGRIKGTFMDINRYKA